MTQAAAPVERGSNFYLGFLFLSKRRREALAAAYAFAREVDDIVDSGELAADEARRRLDFWKEEIDRLYAGKAKHELSRRLAPFVDEFALPKEGFAGLIGGMEMDLEGRRYSDWADLEKYLYGAAGTVGLLCVNIFGYAATPAADIRDYALSMGNAFQLTNILRDVGVDLSAGRVYLPAEEIKRAGYSEGELMKREHTAAFEKLMGAGYERAKGYYRRARSLLHPDDARSMLPAEVMASVYEDLLETMREGGFRVFFDKAKVPARRKVALALRAWMASRGIY